MITTLYFFYAEKALASLYICTGSHESCHRSEYVLAQMLICVPFIRTVEYYGEAAPATMAHLGNHQCVVLMRQKCSQCVVIEFPNKTLASYQEKNKVVIVFWMLLHVNMITAVLRHVYSQFRQLHEKKQLPWQNSTNVLDLQSKP